MEAGSETAMRDYKRVDISMTCGVGEAVGQIGCVAENGRKWQNGFEKSCHLQEPHLGRSGDISWVST